MIAAVANADKAEPSILEKAIERSSKYRARANHDWSSHGADVFGACCASITINRKALHRRANVTRAGEDRAGGSWQSA